MDDSFQFRAKTPPGGRDRTAPLDHGVLSAVLTAQQLATPAACAQARAREGEAPKGEGELLTELLLAGPDWRRAASDQAGCFNRIEVKRRLNLR